MLEEHGDCIGVASLCRKHQRGLAVLVQAVDGYAFAEQMSEPVAIVRDRGTSPIVSHGASWGVV
jgi:hypothetical protein